jgi:type II secretory pathway pseudopilin PulG
MLRPHPVRAGTTLVELLVAIPVLAIVGAIAVAVLLAAHRQARATDGRQGNARELRHGGMVMAAELRPLQPADLVAWSDTSIEFNSLVGTGIACDTRGARRAIDMLPTAGGDPLRTAWITPPEPGDALMLWIAAPSPADSALPLRATLQSVGTSSGCAASPLRSGPGRAVRLTLGDSLPGDVQDGSPVRVTRRMRYALYRAGDGLWYLGRRVRGEAGWDVVQPVIGPVRAARFHGVEFVVMDSLSMPLASGASNVAIVQVRFRAERPGASPTSVDSAFTDVALRGRLDE